MPSWRDAARDRVKTKSEGSTLKITEGENCVRVLPDKKDLLPDGRVGPKGIAHPPYREFKVHREVGPDKALCGCGHTIDGEGACWLCDVKIPELLANPAKKATGVALEAQDQFVVQATRFDPDTSKFAPPKPWWISTGGRSSLAVRVFSKLASTKKDYVDPNKGYNLNITRTGTGLNTRYPELEGDDTATKVPASILAMVKDLDTLIPAYDEEDQKSRYFGRPRRDEVEKDDVEETEETEETAEETEYSEDVETSTEDEPEELETDLPADDEDPQEEAPPEDEPEEEEPEEEPEPEPEPPPRRSAPAKKAPAPAKKTPTAPPAKKPTPGATKGVRR